MIKDYQSNNQNFLKDQRSYKILCTRPFLFKIFSRHFCLKILNFGLDFKFFLGLSLPKVPEVISNSQLTKLDICQEPHVIKYCGHLTKNQFFFSKINDEEFPVKQIRYLSRTHLAIKYFSFLIFFQGHSTKKSYFFKDFLLKGLPVKK